MIHVTVWFIVLLISTFLFRKASGSLSILQPNMISIAYYYSFLISSFIGPLLIVLEIDQYYMINKLTQEEYRWIGFYTIIGVMLFFPMILVMVSKLFGFDAINEYPRYLKKEISPIFKNSEEFFLFFLGLSIVSILAILYTILNSPLIPIFEIMVGNSDLSPGQMRIEAARNFQGNYLIRNIFGIALTPLLSLIAYCYSIYSKDLKWKSLFWILFVGSIFINVYDLAKSPIFFYLIMFFLLRIYVGKMTLNVKKVLLLGSVGAGVLVSMYIVIQGVSDVSSFLSFNSGPVGRLIFAQISPTFLHFQVFGELQPFLHGKSLPGSLINLFDIDQIRSARLVMTEIFPEKVENGTAGVLNTLYVGEAYANFGYIGILVGTIYIAILTQTLYIIFIRLPKDPVVISLFVYFTINIPRTIVGGFTDFLFNPIWVFLVVLFGGFLFLFRVKNDVIALLSNRKQSIR
ncbi:O-antigen polymerase [Rossellomorea aquimaris]|uniref:O-antigen polymerase n=1 Tax=Rossellomorea aquimaris TaxID=189382 RepID=UPI0007D05FAF|nr:O-antigen polymerase [Rossellomorea aquimaris]